MSQPSFALLLCVPFWIAAAPAPVVQVSGAPSTVSVALPSLFSRLVPVDLPPGRQSLAILPFRVEGALRSAGYDAGTMAAEYGVSQYTRDRRFVVVEREGVNQLLQEQALGLSGALDDSGAVRAGKLLAVRYLVVGTVRMVGLNQEFSARMVSVETGQIVSSAMAVVPAAKLEDLYRTAIGERGQLSASLYRSAVAPGWGQFYTDHPVHGGLALGATALALGYLGWCWADFSDRDQILAKYRNGDPTTVRPGQSPDEWIASAEHARTTRNEASARRGGAFGILGAVWVVNLVDAGILGYRDSRRIHTEYFAWIPSVQPTTEGARLSWGF